MRKLSAEDSRAVLEEVPGVLRKLAAERDFYRNGFLKLANRERVEKLAADMLDKGIRSGNVQEIADEIEKSAEKGEINLDITERAVELVGPDMGKTAHVSDELSGSGSSDLERFVLSS